MSSISRNRSINIMLLALRGRWALKRAFASKAKNHSAVCREENATRHSLNSTAV